MKSTGQSPSTSLLKASSHPYRPCVVNGYLCVLADLFCAYVNIRVLSVCTNEIILYMLAHSLSFFSLKLNNYTITLKFSPLLLIEIYFILLNGRMGAHHMDALWCVDPMPIDGHLSEIQSLAQHHPVEIECEPQMRGTHGILNIPGGATFPPCWFEMPLLLYAKCPCIREFVLDCSLSFIDFPISTPVSPISRSCI